VDPEDVDLEQDLATCKDSNGDTKSAEVDDERSDEKQPLALFYSRSSPKPDQIRRPIDQRSRLRELPGGELHPRSHVPSVLRLLLIMA
jgi:hypothetical protein